MKNILIFIAIKVWIILMIFSLVNTKTDKKENLEQQNTNDNSDMEAFMFKTFVIDSAVNGM